MKVKDLRNLPITAKIEYFYAEPRGIMAVYVVAQAMLSIESDYQQVQLNYETIRLSTNAYRSSSDEALSLFCST